MKFASEDNVQKTWIPEGTEEYKQFKLVTLENNFLAKFLGDRFRLNPGELLLDVGGREGDIAIKLQSSENIHIVDPDPTLKIPFVPGKFWNQKIQNLDLKNRGLKYKLIICSHVLGYLGNQKVQEQVFDQLVELLESNGTLVLFYNTNEGYMSDLLAFSKIHLDHGHYDYFEEKLLEKLQSNKYTIEKKDISFALNYSSYEDLARCAWFLFGAMDQDIPKVAGQFLPKLKKDLLKPSFSIEERVVLITRRI